MWSYEVQVFSGHGTQIIFLMERGVSRGLSAALWKDIPWGARAPSTSQFV